MKIAHILNNFLPDHVAGTEVYAFNLGKELREKAYEVIFIIPGYHEISDTRHKTGGMDVIKYAEPSIVDRSLQMGKRKPDGLQNFISIVKNENPDIVHFHELAGSNGITLHHVISAKTAGFKTVLTLHLAGYTTMNTAGNDLTDVFRNKSGSLGFYKRKGIHGAMALFIYNIGLFFKTAGIDVSGWGKWGTALGIPSIVGKRKSDFLRLISVTDAVVTISHWYHNALKNEDIPKEKIHFIDQGIQASCQVTLHRQVPDKELKAIFIGRISHFKGVRNLIQIVKDLGGLRLDIFGSSGDDDSYIEDCTNLAENAGAITLKGGLEPGQVVSVIAKYDLLILPSTIHEMSPLVIREAFAAGIPVLASDSMGAKELISEGKNGWLFRMNDWDDFRGRLEWLITHPEKIKEANSFPRIRTFGEVAEEYEKLYEGVMTAL